MTEPIYEPVEDEPNLDIAVRSRRSTDKNGKPGSAWQLGYALEGEWKAPLSQRQRDYAASMLRLVAQLVQEPNPQGMTAEARIAALAQEYQARLRATMDALVNAAQYLVRQRGLQGAASLLHMKEYKLEQLLKGHGAQVPAIKELSRPRPEEPDILAMIAMEQIREKVTVA